MSQPWPSAASPPSAEPGVHTKAAARAAQVTSHPQEGERSSWQAKVDPRTATLDFSRCTPPRHQGPGPRSLRKEQDLAKLTHDYLPLSLRQIHNRHPQHTPSGRGPKAPKGVSCTLSASDFGCKSIQVPRARLEVLLLSLSVLGGRRPGQLLGRCGLQPPFSDIISFLDFEKKEINK